MLRRLFSLVVLLAIVGIALYLWRARPAGSQTAGTTARELGGQARELGAEARDKLAEVGHDLHDTKITASVKTAISLNRSLRGSSIEVGTENGVVTLRGRVESEAQRVHAEAVAAEVPDVTRVASQLEVVPTAPPAGGFVVGAQMSNAERVAAAQRALQANANLSGFALQVREEGGRLVLRGRVSTAAEKDLAGLLAREGAVGPVENAIEVTAGVPQGR
jgi:osmotically-inducible protein OsmY